MSVWQYAITMKGKISGMTSFTSPVPWQVMTDIVTIQQKTQQKSKAIQAHLCIASFLVWWINTLCCVKSCVMRHLGGWWYFNFLSVAYHFMTCIWSCWTTTQSVLLGCIRLPINSAIIKLSNWSWNWSLRGQQAVAAFASQYFDPTTTTLSREEIWMILSLA